MIIFGEILVKMESQQSNNGFTKIPNEIIIALYKIRLSGEERQCLDFIIYKTYSFHKKSDWISLSQFSKNTGINRRNIIRALKKLIDKKLIIGSVKKDTSGGVKKDTMSTKVYELNDDFNQWICSVKKDTQCQKRQRGSVKKDNEAVSKKTHTKENITKENITKNNIYCREAKKVLQYLNEKKGSRYTKTKEIEARLKQGATYEDCILVIENKFKDPYFKENPNYLNPVTLFRESHFDNYKNEDPKEKYDPFSMINAAKERAKRRER